MKPITLKGKTIKDYGMDIEINGVFYEKPSNRSVVVSEYGIYCGQHEFVGNKWKITRKSLKQMLFG